jgi:tetratricopeptide (TPR) repeat protein
MPSHRSRQTPTGHALLTFAAAAWLGASILYLGGGCAQREQPETARSAAALDSYVQGVLAYQQGNTAKAMTELQEAVSKKGDLVMARSMLGDLYRSRSDYDAAREQYEALSKLDAYSYQNHYRLGLVYQLLDRLQEAAVAYLKAVDLKPTDPASNMSLGTVYLGLAQRGIGTTPDADLAELRERAVKYAQRAVELDPNNAAAQVNLGVTLDEVKQYARAEAAYRKCLELDANQPTVQLYLGENLLAQKKAREARSVFSELVKVEDTPRNRKRLGDAYAAEGNFADALNQYQAALKMDANYYPALNQIGAAYIAQYEKGLGLDEAKRKAALDAWQQSLSIYRTQPQITALIQKHSKARAY